MVVVDGTTTSDWASCLGLSHIQLLLFFIFLYRLKINDAWEPFVTQAVVKGERYKGGERGKGTCSITAWQKKPPELLQSLVCIVRYQVK
jgi:hypothetical protein